MPDADVNVNDTEDHLEPEAFHDLIEGHGSNRYRAGLEEHLDGCPRCVETLALILSMDRPATAAEEATLARLPRVTPEERVRALAPRIASSRPEPGSDFDWRSIAIAAAVAIVLFGGGLYIYYEHWLPAASRRTAAQTLSALIELRNATGRIPLRYLPEMERAAVTRSGFDVPEPIEADLLAELREAVERSPEPKAVETLALLLLDEGELDDAERLLNRVLTIVPESASALNGLAVVQYRRAELQPEDAYALRQRGLAFLRRAQAAEPENLLVLYNLAKFYEALGMNGAAIQSWTRYLNEDPGSRWAQEAAEQLAQLEGR